MPQSRSTPASALPNDLEIGDTDELIDSRELAHLLGLAHPHSVSLHQRRYADMPRAVADLGNGRPRLGLRPAILEWIESRA